MSNSKEGAQAVREHLAYYGNEPQTVWQVFESIISLLKTEVGAMNTDNFIVRAKRRLVEKYKKPEPWVDLDEEKLDELEREIAGLPSETEPDALESKQFDLLILRLQLARIKPSQGFRRLKQQVQEIAAALEESSGIPVIRDQLELIQDLQTDGWWDDVTLPMLEVARLRLRSLVKLIEPKRGSPVYTDFTEVMGEESEISLPGFTGSMSLERFREKVRTFLRQHLDRESIQKLRMNEPLTSSDLEELEQILLESGAGDSVAIQRASENGLGLFVRSLVGLDREAAKSALNQFISGAAFSANQIEFVNLVIDYLTENGVMEPRALYESPFTDINPLGPDGLFESKTVDAILGFLDMVRSRAVA